MPKPTASLSLDLDNRWAYLRTHGLESWQDFPSYLPEVCERIRLFTQRASLRLSVFVVGKDLEFEASREAVASLHADGHEIANHSYWHYPWLESLDAKELEREVVDAEVAIESLTGNKPRGFRAPGFSGSPALHALLAKRGYAYDASAFPTVIGPLAGFYARLKSFGAKHDGGDSNRQRFASIGDGFGSLRPYPLTTPEGVVVEVPVTTMPLFRVPIHVTYLMYLNQFSQLAAKTYLTTAIRLCRLRGIGPSMLLHPLDFLGGEEEPQLGFFPGMKLSRTAKHALLEDLIALLTNHFNVQTVAEHAKAYAEVGKATGHSNEVASL